MGLTPHMELVEVVATMLRQLSIHCIVDRIFVAHDQATSCQQARAVVLHMWSVFQKKGCNKVKSFLAQYQVYEPTVNTASPTSHGDLLGTSTGTVATSDVLRAIRGTGVLPGETPIQSCRWPSRVLATQNMRSPQLPWKPLWLSLAL
jgi:hypothetical protein